MVDGICSWAKNYLDATSADASSAQQLSVPPSNSYGIDTAVSHAGG
jgi:hypothetical protein